MRKKKLLVIVVILLFGILIGYNIGKPKPITNAEIDYYESIETTVWEKGISYVEPKEDIHIDITKALSEKTISISTSDGNKSSITVVFLEKEKMVTINPPSVSLIGCMFFYGILITGIGSVIYLFFLDCIKNIKKNRREKSA